MAIEDTDADEDITHLKKRSLAAALTPLALVGGALLAGVAVLAVWLSQDHVSGGNGMPEVVLKLPRDPGIRAAPPRPGDGAPLIRKSLKADVPDTTGPVSPRALSPDGSFRVIDPLQARGSGHRALRSAPIKAVTEYTRLGPLPRIARDGRLPAQVYARPVSIKPLPGGGQPARIALFIGGMGISVSGTSRAINTLPEEITLGFAPYGRNLQGWVNKARRNGHEVMLQLPMEPFDYPDNDPGPHTLLSSVSAKENIARLKWLMTRFAGYFGVANYMGARFTSRAEALGPVLNWIGKRGVVFLDDGGSRRSKIAEMAATAGIKVKVAATVIDEGQTPGSIRTRLAGLEAAAKKRGLVIGVGTGLPLTVKTVAKWAKTLKKRGIVLIPVSAAFKTSNS
ncbi:MAG TPA: divergent polysaccharide deacetylase family protein [Rhizobiales bacterium]|nr:divergent polysaccharide deacetylase family protein [Hyphomicrobiales bacterium]